ncbi:DPCD protein, putative [Trichomonas vaginalis G3]|uniref:Protein DPCD n=1 Tax=Trichomonas vaginalis (strain ATCC PRA-98 / G3) TaxID=412133 RepID=A2FD60_TRIV3|nr:third ventricle development protein family [Trichomonas vaginalis G3]EAX97167.1 DPCD protein, putative [Trichomonas vaginalis G3]KAI5491088.1 third ventricle development protein family [Trichomonas vaginalis G3]|eukprot:XP_001310097.1 DPCD protein [Trichomonas vaginalis G3]
MTIAFPKAVAYNTGGYKTIVYDEKEGKQVVDICELDTGKLLARKERVRHTSGSDGPWEWTYGSPIEQKQEVETISASSKNPVFLRLDTDNEWQWRVRNIPYPANFYNVTVDEPKNQIVIRTTNKKYFKRIDAPEGEKFVPSKLQWAWSYNTLVIQHEKPPRVVAADKELCKWRRGLPLQEDKDPDCRV